MNSDDTSSSWKQRKREQKMAWKEQKRAQKLARKEEKRAQKLARKQQQVGVSCRARLELADVIDLLRQVLDGLEHGAVTIEHGDQQLTLEVPPVVDVRVRARQKYKTEGLTIRLRWPRSCVLEPKPSIKIASVRSGPTAQTD